jgi:hypothetical protein
MSSASTGTTSHSKPKSVGQSAHTPPSRTPADSGRQSALFQRELERQSKPDPNRDSEKGEGTAKRPEKGDIDEYDGQHGGEEKRDQHFSHLPSDAITSALFRAAQVSASQAVAAPPEMPAEHLARIAAAIQELVASGATANYQLQLPLGNMVISGAILGRDATGNLAIQLIASATLTPQQAAILRSDLARRLERKRLKIASLNVTGGGTETPRSTHAKGKA